MPAVFLEIDKKLLADAINTLGHIPQGAPTAIMRALNRGAAKLQTEAARYIAARYNVKQADVKKQMKVIKATKARLYATVVFTGRRLPLGKFASDYRHKKRTSRIKTAPLVEIVRGVKKQFPGAFFSSTEHGHYGTRHYGIFVRKPGVIKGKRKAQILNRAITEKMSLSIPEMAGYHEAVEAYLEAASEAVNKELEHQIDWLLQGGKAK